MPDITFMLHHGSGYGVLLPSAVLLGALHGLEPGHSKTLMAAFIIAVRGTVWQSVLLGMAAALSHSAVVWGVALVGLHWGAAWGEEVSMPYFQLASGLVMLLLAGWMLLRLWRHRAASREHHGLESDAHALAHAHDIKHRFQGATVTHGQVVLFGLTGGLMPCPAAITVLLLCLQLRHATLGLVLVAGFSLGLALTLAASGALAAYGVHHATKRYAGVARLAERAPLVSNALIIMLGGYITITALLALRMSAAT